MGEKSTDGLERASAATFAFVRAATITLILVTVYTAWGVLVL